jgi:tetratricopeptide (TPR) repeat protein
MKRTTEEKENPTEDDVRTRVKELASPMLQSEYLENLLKRMALQPNVRIFIAKNLADLYVRRGLWASAARVLESAAESSEKFEERKSLFMGVGVYYIKAMEYMLADDAFRKSVEAASPGEKARLSADIRNLFMREADEMFKDGRIAKAAKLYERILRTTVTNEEKKKVMTNLSVLYEKLARISDSIAMRESAKRL